MTDYLRNPIPSLSFHRQHVFLVAFLATSLALVSNQNTCQAFAPLNTFNLKNSNAFQTFKLFESSSSAAAEEEAPTTPIDVSIDDRLYRIRLPRAPGIEWGTDLSFAFVSIRDMEPAGPASLSGQVSKGDQLCELIPVTDKDSKTNDNPPINLMGAPFDFVMSAFAGLDKSIQLVDLVFFKGTKEELKALVQGKTSVEAESEIITVTVIQNKGAKDEVTKTLTAKAGVNVRQLLIDNGINVYQSVTRWTNCKGKQLCGTCIVNIPEGGKETNRKSMDEESTLRENPETYRLSCITFAYGDITVETFPPIKAAQWTR
jgi:ferredoxin